MRRVALGFLVLALAAPASAQAATTGRLLVSVSPPAHGTASAASTAKAVIARSGARSTGRGVPQLGLVTVRARRGESLRALAARLRRDPRVRAVDLEHRAQLRAVPNDPAINTPDPAPNMAGESLQWGLVRSHFPQAWDQADGDSVTIAVIDSGIDAGHPDLAPKVRRAMDFDSDPRNGPATVDEDGHGTHVASLACAVPNNGIGLAGAGFDCGLIIEKSDLTDSSVIASIVDATDNGAGVISMSIGTDGRATPPQAMVDAVDYAYRRGVVLVAAASDGGRSGRPVTEQGDPANILQPTGTGSNIRAGRGLSVTAASFDGDRAPFAGAGTQISLAAYGSASRPGANGVLGAFPRSPARIEEASSFPPAAPCRCRTDLAGSDDYAFLEGTSMATPVVAGAAALVRDRNPDLGPADVIRILKQTAQRAPGAGWTSDLGWGVVDAAAAVVAAGRLDRRAPTSTVTAPATTHARTIRLRISASDSAAPGVRVAGVRSIRVYRSTDGARARRIATTSASTLRLPARSGARYAFFTQAVDRAGNVEPAPQMPDARTRVVRR